MQSFQRLLTIFPQFPPSIFPHDTILQNTAKWNTHKESQYFVFAREKMNPAAMDIKKRTNRFLLKLEDVWKLQFHSSQLCSVQWIPDLSISTMQIIPPTNQHGANTNKWCFCNGSLLSFQGNSAARLFASGGEM